MDAIIQLVPYIKKTSKKCIKMLTKNRHFPTDRFSEFPTDRFSELSNIPLS